MVDEHDVAPSSPATEASTSPSAAAHPFMVDGEYAALGLRFRVKTYPRASRFAAGGTVIATWRAAEKGGEERFRGVGYVDRKWRRLKIWRRIWDCARDERAGYREIIEVLTAVARDPSLLTLTIKDV